MYVVLLKYVICVFLAFIAYKISQSPSVDVVTRSLPEPPKHEGVLAKNNKLRSAEIFFRDELVGPESFAVDGEGNIYTGLLNGSIVSFHKDNPHSGLKVVVDKVRCSKDAAKPRVLGLRVKGSYLYAVDPNVGIVKINLEKEYDMECVIDVEKDLIDGRKAVFLDDLDVTRDGVIYVSEPSNKYDLENCLTDLFEGGSNGALFRFDTRTKEFTKIMSDLYFGNGIQLSPDESFVLVNEGTAARITRFWIKGDKSGTSDVFVENLPGLPDNIRPRKAGGYWVAFGASRFHLNSRYDDLLVRPWKRLLMAKFISYEFFISIVDPNVVGQAIAIDENGDIVESFQDHGGKKITDMTEANEIDGFLYIAGYLNEFIGRVKL